MYESSYFVKNFMSEIQKKTSGRRHTPQVAVLYADSSNGVSDLADSTRCMQTGKALTIAPIATIQKKTSLVSWLVTFRTCTTFRLRTSRHTSSSDASDQEGKEHTLS
jgi:hypothetical protein